MTTQSTAAWTAIILAAGEGRRMRSARPKVLHEIAGRTLVSWVVKTALRAGAPKCIVVVGHGGDEVTDHLAECFPSDVEVVVQPEQRGTGDAVRCAIEAHPALKDRVVVLYGDCPLVPSEVVTNLIEASIEADAALGLVTASLVDPTGYGRIVRDATGNVARVVEHQDCTDDERKITEVNPGLYAVDVDFLRESIGKLGIANAQGELYLTDLVALAAERGAVVSTEADMGDLMGVNDQRDLAASAARRRRQIAEELGKRGVAIADLDALYVDADCEVEAGASLGAQVHLRDGCIVRAGATIDVGCVLSRVVVEANATVLPYTVARDSTIGPGATVGPFSHLRPGSILGPKSKVGNFSETKQTTLGEGSKVNHLSYVGNGTIGKGVNIGAGTIFCNYDGARKHETVIGDDVFIGSDTQLVAPVKVGRGAYVASGTTITRDVPEDALAVGRAKQDNKPGYAARLRARLLGKKD